MDTLPQQNPDPQPANRRLTMCGKTFARGGTGMFSRSQVTFPSLLLTGKWLQDCGFCRGHVVNIACEKGRLTITLSEDQPWVD